ncbi:rhodanese-like domain-containing protein [Salinimicrobium gaetbulicola]|uniref:Rhodanese-like domain-containing protein n=1 Tax=Salinimicrobium gaetbulicola TaxID=999702 RepID=A0ABW3IDK4_9FLAO
MKKLIPFLFGIFLITSMNAQQDPYFKVMDVDKYEQAVARKNVQLVDVRTAEEYKEGHIKGAKNIDFFADDFLKQFRSFDKEEPLYLYCRSGNRSAKASKQLSDAGFKNIIDLKGGYKAWKAAGKK